MILSGSVIKKSIQRGVISIKPLSEGQIDQAHVDLHLGEINGQNGLFTLAPKGFVLAKTLEKITLPTTVCGLIEGRAGLAKKGVSVEQSSKFIEPGTNNTITLEVFNASNEPVALEIGQRIAKLILMRVVDSI